MRWVMVFLAWSLLAGCAIPNAQDGVARTTFQLVCIFCSEEDAEQTKPQEELDQGFVLTEKKAPDTVTVQPIAPNPNSVNPATVPPNQVY